MKKFWISSMAVGVLACPAWAQKIEIEKPDREKIIHVQTALNHLTILEMTEQVGSVAVGSPVFRVEWRENKVFIEPTEAGVATNLFVWTASSRFNYELDPAGGVPQMEFAIDQPVVDPPSVNASANRAREPNIPSPTGILLAAKPVRLLGPISEQNRIAVYITDLLEHDGQLLIRYSIRNGTNEAYVPGGEQVVKIKAPRYRESLYTLHDFQLGSNEALHLKSSGEIPLEVANGEVQSSRIEPGEEVARVVAIKLPHQLPEPLVIRLLFLASPAGPVSATLVL